MLFTSRKRNNVKNPDEHFTVQSLGQELERLTRWYIDVKGTAAKLMEQHVYEKFLGCSLANAYKYEQGYHGPLLKNYAVNLIPYIKSSYTDRCEDAINVINNLDPAILSAAGSSLYHRHQHSIGFIRSCFRDPVNGTIYEYPSGGATFFTDQDGLPMIINMNGTLSYSHRSIHCDFTFELYTGPQGGKDQVFRFIDGLESYARDNCIFRGGAISQKGDIINLSHQDWDSIKLTSNVRNQVKFHIVDFLDTIKDFRKYNVRTSRGIILTGKPGNGKTMLGRILATNLQVPFIWLTAQDMAPMNNDLLHNVYSTANRIGPAIIFIEDADIFMQKRNMNLSPFTLSELLNRIDGLEENDGIITIITANSPHLLDEAVKDRPRRFDVIIELPNPAFKERRDIITEKLSPWMRAEDAELVNEIARKMHGYSGAHVSELCERMVLSMIYKNEEQLNSWIIQEELCRFGFPVPGRVVGTP